MEQLIISSNELTSLPEEIMSLKKLRTLGVQNNAICTVSDSL